MLVPGRGEGSPCLCRPLAGRLCPECTWLAGSGRWGRAGDSERRPYRAEDAGGDG